MKKERTAFILITSDRAHSGDRPDETAPKLKDLLQEYHFEVTKIQVVPDDLSEITDQLIQAADRENIDLIITSGGTGPGPRDVTVEATHQILDKEIPGLAEYMRFKSSEIVKSALISRAKTGIRNNSLIINLPGSPKGALENLGFIADVLHHTLDMMEGKGH